MSRTSGSCCQPGGGVSSGPTQTFSPSGPCQIGIRWPPPQPRDAPVVHVVDPAEPARLQALRVNHDVAVAHGVAGGLLGHGLDVDPPLQAQPRLDRLAAALGMTHAVQVGPLLGDDAALLGQRLAHLHPGLEPVHTVELCSGVRDPAPLIHHGRHRQVSRMPISKSLGSWAGRDFHRAGAEFGSTCSSATMTIPDRRTDGAWDVPPDPGSARRRGAPRSRCRPASSPSAWWPPRCAARVVQRAVPERHQLASTSVLDLQIGDRGLQHR